MAQIPLSPKPTPVWVTDCWSWKPGAYCTPCRQLNKVESVLSKHLVWSLLPARSWLVTASSGQLSLSDNITPLGSPYRLYICLRREGPSVSCQFQELPEAWIVYLLSLMSFLAWWMVSPPLRLSSCWPRSNILCLKKLPSKMEILLSEETANFTEDILEQCFSYI